MQFLLSPHSNRFILGKSHCFEFLLTSFAKSVIILPKMFLLSGSKNVTQAIESCVTGGGPCGTDALLT